MKKITISLVSILALAMMNACGSSDTNAADSGDTYNISNVGDGAVTVNIGNVTTTTTSSGLCVVNENNTTRPCTQKEIDATTNVLNRTTDALYSMDVTSYE